jgi:DNA mismatch endonuclease, patch repair protein
MADRISLEKRRWNMQRIRSKDTKPELIVRSTLHKMGFRFRIHKKDLPGKPDIVIKRLNTIIFVHGCFWHRHENCIEASRPKTNSEFWEKKIIRNIERDKKHWNELKKIGWNVVIVWECQLKNNYESNKNLLIDLLGLNE